LQSIPKNESFHQSPFIKCEEAFEWQMKRRAENGIKDVHSCYLLYTPLFSQWWSWLLQKISECKIIFKSAKEQVSIAAHKVNKGSLNKSKNSKNKLVITYFIRKSQTVNMVGN
jgi:hypothetical protein